MAKKNLTSKKAKEILHDGTVHGKPITDKQRRYFGWIAGGGKADAGMDVDPVKPIYTADPNDPRLRAYQDSLQLSSRKQKNPNPQISIEEWEKTRGRGTADKYKERGIMPIGIKDFSEIPYRASEPVFAKPKQKVEYKPRQKGNVNMSKSRPDVAVDADMSRRPNVERAKTEYSYTYPTFDENVQNTMYFPDANALRQFTDKYGYTDRTFTPKSGSATGNPQYQMGGVLPGVAGFMYSRNASEYKKRKAAGGKLETSAYYQQGLDFEPKMISEAGGFIAKGGMGVIADDGTDIVMPQDGVVQRAMNPGYQGLGYSDQGYKYNSAWGGRWEAGGPLPKGLVSMPDPTDPPKAKSKSFEADIMSTMSTFDQSDFQTLVKNAAQKVGISPYLLGASALQEGMNLAAKKPDVVSKAYEAEYRKSDRLKDYPVDGFYNYGLDNFGTMYSDLRRRGYVPEDLDFRAYTGINEKGNTVLTAAFKNNQDALVAKAAVLKDNMERVNSYARKIGLRIGDDERNYFTMAAYNGGFGSAMKMMNELRDNKYPSADYISKGYTSLKGVHKNIQPRMQKMQRLQGMFEAGGTIQDKGQLNKLDQLTNFTNYNDNE